MKLAGILKDGKTYSIFFEGKRDGCLIRINGAADRIGTAEYACTFDDEAQILTLHKRKQRTLFIPYGSIRYFEQSKLAEAEALLFDD